jgi:SAM-dependent methyltransferase
MNTESTLSRNDVFNEIYNTSYWGYKSGLGSYPENAVVWTSIVNSFLEKKDIITVLDIGCGDWRLGKTYMLENKQYTGMDVSSVIINEIQANSKENIKFVYGDASVIDLQKNDLILIKDVLQHLSNRDVLSILNKVIGNCKYALICNDFYLGDNVDIVAGGWRPIDLSKDPFNYNFKRIGSWHIGDFDKVVYLYSSSDFGEVEK